MGDSYIHRAARRASHRPGGTHPGVQNVDVFWRGPGGLKWLQVLSEVVAIGRISSGPVVLVKHAGCNDLCSTRFTELLSIICSDMGRINMFFQDLIIVWSESVLRVVWNGAHNPAAIEGRLINSRVSQWIRSDNGVVVHH